MASSTPKIFVHQDWTPGALERLTNLSQVLVRDWRRRGLAPASDGRKLGLRNVAQLFILSELVASGFGPKRIKSIAEQHDNAVTRYALMEPCAWADDGSYRAWVKSPSSKCGARYVVISGHVAEPQSEETLPQRLSSFGSVVTVIDLKALGQKLSTHLAERPSFATNSSGGA